MLRDNYMTTGEFAKLMGVSKHTLFHYDDIKLFCPAMITEQKYRYYSFHQMETFNTILLLRESGMSLEEIRNFLTNKSPETLIDLFSQREAEIDREIAKLNAMKQWVSQKTNKIIAAQKQNFSDISVVTYPERYYMTANVAGTSAKAFYMTTNELITEFESYGIKNDYDIAYLQHGSQVEHGIYDGYDNIVLLLEHKLPKGHYKVLPAGNYLTAYHIGHWDTIKEAYERLLLYKKTYGIHTLKDYFEYYIVDDFSAKDINEYVTCIFVKMLET